MDSLIRSFFYKVSVFKCIINVFKCIIIIIITFERYSRISNIVLRWTKIFVIYQLPYLYGKSDAARLSEWRLSDHVQITTNEERNDSRFAPSFKYNKKHKTKQHLRQPSGNLWFLSGSFCNFYKLPRQCWLDVRVYLYSVFPCSTKMILYKFQLHPETTKEKTSTTLTKATQLQNNE